MLWRNGKVGVHQTVAALLRQLQGTEARGANRAVSALELIQLRRQDGEYQYGLLAIAARNGGVDTVRALWKAGVRKDPRGARDTYECAKPGGPVEAFLRKVKFAPRTHPAREDTPTQGFITMNVTATQTRCLNDCIA